MKQHLLFAGIAALGFSSMAFARPGMGQGMGNPHAMGAFGNPHGAVAPRGIGFGARPSGPVGYGVGGCPPGLAKKAVPCVPPGLAKQQFAVGQRVPTRIGSLLAGSSLPRTVRRRYGSSISPRSRYLYNNGYLYRVNPTTRVVQGVVRTRR